MIIVTKRQLVAIFAGVGVFWLIFSTIYYALDVPDRLFAQQPKHSPTPQAPLRKVSDTKTPLNTSSTAAPMPTPTPTPTRVPTVTPSPTSTPTFMPPTATPTRTASPTPVPYSYEGFTVPPRGTHRFPISLREGSKLEGYFQDARGNYIAFSVENPFGKEIFYQDRVVGRFDFTLEARESGVYNLVFKNNDKIFARTMGLWWRVQ